MASKLTTHRTAEPSTSLRAGMMMPSSEAAIWGRVFAPNRDDLTAEEAQSLLRVDLGTADKQRAHELLVKNREDTLTADERSELEGYRKVGYVIDLMHAQARRALKKQNSPA